MKNVLITSFDMDVGGVERSLVAMLENFDYQSNKVDLLLYRHQGDFMNLLTNKVNLLDEVPEYSTFRKPINQIFYEKKYNIVCSRILSKLMADLRGKAKGMTEPGYYQMQLMWKYALPFLPKVKQNYDVAISYLWPHYFVAEKVTANLKIAWIHTDYSVIDTDIGLDLKMWNNYDYIIAVSEECKNSFIKKYYQLTEKVIVVENIISPDFICKMAEVKVEKAILDKKSFNLLTVARLSHAKGIDIAVSVLKEIVNRGYDVNWYVIGYGGDEDKIRTLIKINNLEDKFILLGKKTNPYPYINDCDLYVQPSRYEGKAVTVTEAKVLGKPIIINNYPTAKSQVCNNYDGLIASSQEDLVNKIIKLIDDNKLRDKLTRNLQKHSFDNKQELDKLFRLF